MSRQGIGADIAAAQQPFCPELTKALLISKGGQSVLTLSGQPAPIETVPCAGDACKFHATARTPDGMMISMCGLVAPGFTLATQVVPILVQLGATLAKALENSAAKVLSEMGPAMAKALKPVLKDFSVHFADDVASALADVLYEAEEDTAEPKPDGKVRPQAVPSLLNLAREALDEDLVEAENATMPEKPE